MDHKNNKKLGFNRLKGAAVGLAVGLGVVGAPATLRAEPSSGSTGTVRKTYGSESRSNLALRWLARVGLEQTSDINFFAKNSRVSTSFGINITVYNSQSDSDRLDNRGPILPYPNKNLLRNLNFFVFDNESIPEVPFAPSDGLLDFDAPEGEAALLNVGTHTDILEGIDADLSVYISGESDGEPAITRALFTVSNTTDEDIEVSLVHSTLFDNGYDGGTLKGTSNSDTVLDDDDTWAVFQIGSLPGDLESAVCMSSFRGLDCGGESGRGALVLVSGYGPGAEVQPINFSDELNLGLEGKGTSIGRRDGLDGFDPATHYSGHAQRYTVTLPAQSSRSVMMYVAIANSEESSEEGILAIEEDQTLLLDGLSEEQLAQIVNYRLVEPDVDNTEDAEDTEDDDDDDDDEGILGAINPALLIPLGGLLVLRRRKR